MTRSAFDDAGHTDHYEKLTPLLTRHLNLERLKGAKVIDLACGHGWWGEALRRHGADVIFIDGREDNLATVRKRNPGAAAHLMNAETDIFPVSHADIVLCMGLIYHIEDPASLFAKIAAITERVFVETICLDQVGANIVYADVATDTAEASLRGKGCRPTPRWVTRELRRAGFTEIADISDASGNRPATPSLPGLLYRWDYENTCGWRRNDCTLRRMFMASRAGANDSMLRW
jgi:SAM-dependent methyltransferase